MYIVRNTFIAKPGSAGKLVKMFKEVAADPSMKNARVLLDFVTDFNKIVFEHEVDSLADFEQGMEDMKMNPDPVMAEKMKGYTDLYLTGKREIFKVVD